jgi:hypothetical protein
MSFYEDERIRNKNSRYTKESITNNDISLKLNNIAIVEIIELLVKNGYKVKLEHHNVLCIHRKQGNEGNEGKTIHDNIIATGI